MHDKTLHTCVKGHNIFINVLPVLILYILNFDFYLNESCRCNLYKLKSMQLLSKLLHASIVCKADPML